VPRDLVATSVGRVDREGARDLTDIEQRVEHAPAVECGLTGGFVQSGVDDRRDRGFRRGVADGSAHAVEEIEGLGPAQELMAGCATDGRVHQCDERRLANRLYVALMLVSPHDKIAAVGVDGIAVLPRGTRSGFGSEPDSGGPDTARARTERRNRGGKAHRAPLQCVTRMRSPRGICLPTAPHPSLKPERRSCQERTRPLILVVARSRPRTFGVAAAEQNRPAVSSAWVEMRERVGRCSVAASGDAGREPERRDATKLVLGIEMMERPCDDYREASLPIGGGAERTHGLCLCGWLKEEHGQDRR
jgi:hypothetical protein